MPLPSLRLWSCGLLALCACVAARPAQPTVAAPSLREQCRTNLQACLDLEERPASEEEAGCERGDATDCFLFAQSVFSEDQARAYQLLGKACQMKHFTACEHLFREHSLGAGGHQEFAAVRPMLEQACAGDEPTGCFLLGEVYSQFGSEERDEPRARAYYEQACERGEARGCTGLGRSLVADEDLSGDVPQADIDRAKALFERACEAGDGDGCMGRGRLAMGPMAMVLEPAACEFFKKGCDADSASACDSYGDVCDEDFRADYERLRHAERGCTEGSSEDCEQAGLAHERGEGTRRFLPRAAKHYARGCELGSSLSCERLANLQGSGYDGVPPQPEKARQHLLGACERKLPGACVSVGQVLREGRSWLPKDLKAASGYSQRACAEGDAEGCEALALAYQEGLGVEQSGERAFEHHLEACGLGRMESCVNAGASAEALKRREEAVRAYQRSCFRGTAAGCQALTRLGEATTLVERSQQVELPGSRAEAGTPDLLITPGPPLLLSSSQGRLQLIDITRGEVVGAPVDLSSEEVQWKTPYVMSKLVRKPYSLTLSWDARAQEPFGFFEDSLQGMRLWRPGRAHPPSPNPEEKAQRCLPLAYQPSGRGLLMKLAFKGDCGNDSSELQQFDVETGMPQGPRVQLEAPVKFLASSSDGSRYAAALKGGAVRLIDAATGKVTVLPDAHAKEVDSLSFHPTRPLLATASREEGLVRLWDLSGGTSAPVTIRESVTQVRFSPDGKLLAAASGNEGLLLLDASTGQRASPPIPLSNGMLRPLIMFSPDGKRLAVADSEHGVLLVTLRGAAPSGGVAPVPSWFTRIRRLEPPVLPKPPPILKDGRFEGAVKFEGKPVPNAVVVLTPHQEWDDAMALGAKRYPVRPDGTFVLTNVPRIQWRLSVEAPGKVKWVRLFNGREQAQHLDIDATLERAATLRGRVLSPERRPAAGVKVAWRDEYTQEFSTVVTDARGRFVLDHLRPRSYFLKMMVSNGDLLSQRVKLDKPGPRDVELVLRKRSDPAVLRLRVLTAGGKPIPGVELDLEDGVKGVTDAQGRWHTDEVEATAPVARWKERIYRPAPESVSIPYPEEVVITIPDAEL